MCRWSYLFGILRDPEWANYLHYRWRRDVLTAPVAPLHLAGAVSWSLFKRALGARRWRVTRRSIWPAATNFQRVADPPGLALAGRGNGSAAHLLTSEDIKAIADYANTHLTEHVRQTADQAEGILVGNIPVASRRRVKVTDSSLWRGPFHDQEDLFYLNRWYHGLTLARAFAYTGNERYVQGFIDMLEHWVHANPQDASSPVWESYSVGERIVNWLYVDALVGRVDGYRSRGVPAVRRALAQHAEYLACHLENRVVHNHLVNNARALFFYGVLCPDLPCAHDLRSQAWAILVRELEGQFLADGMLGEQSTHYHLLLLSRYAEVLLLARRNGYKVPVAVTAKVRKMFGVGGLFVRPDGTLAMVGDVSPDVDVLSLVGVLAVGAALFGVPSPVPPNGYAIWMLGLEGLEAWSPQPQATGLWLLPASGYAVYRSTDLHLVMHADPRGGVIRHGHQDFLGIDLWADGHAILPDAGNVSFSMDRWREYFCGAYAHSTVVVDGLWPAMRFAVLRDLFLDSYAHSEAWIRSLPTTGGDVVIEGWHAGYHRLPAPVDVSRRLRVVGGRTVIVHDELRGEGRHRVEIVFQFGRNLVHLDRGSKTLNVFESGGREIATVSFHSQAELCVHVYRGQTKPSIRGWFSPDYGQREEATTAVCSLQMTGQVVVETAITLQRRGESSACAA